MSTYSHTFDTTTLPDGTYSLRTTATDSGGLSTVASAPFAIANAVIPTALTIYVEIEFDDGVWTAVDHCRGFNTKTGRDLQTDKTSAGTATFQFTNIDRALDPAYELGPYYGRLLPRKRIRVRTALDGTVYPIWQGYIDSYEQAGDGTAPKVLFCTITATDGFKIASLATLGRSIYELAVAADQPVAWYPMTETQDNRMVDASGFGLHGRHSDEVSGRTVDSLTVSGASETSVQFTGTEWATVPVSAQFTDAPFSVETWVRTSDTAGGLFVQKGTDGSIFSVVIASGRITATISSTGASWSSSADTVISDNRLHQIVVTVEDLAAAPTVYIDGDTPPQTTTGSGTVVLTPGVAWVGWDKYGSGGRLVGTLGQLALYSPDLTPTRIAAHYSAGVAPYDLLRTGEVLDGLLDAIGWPSGDRDIDTGVTTLGPVSYNNPGALELMQTVELTEQGRMWVGPDGAWTFRDRYFALTNDVAQTPQGAWSDASNSFGGSGTLPATIGDLIVGTTIGDWWSTYLFVDGGVILPYQSLEYHDNDDLIYNIVTASGRDGVTVEARDQASIDAYGPRSIDIGSGLWRTTEEVESICQAFLARYKDPRRRFTKMVIKPARSPDASYPMVFARGLVHRISLVHAPALVSSWSSEVLIEGIEHSVNLSDGVDWTTTYSLGPADDTNIFRWDVSTWDGPSVWAA